jgi:hypothetical protein
MTDAIGQQPPGTPDRTLAVSLSGGGHRATLFGLGALLYLVDAEAHRRVTSIASVSGGSLTNGFVGQTLEFQTTTSADFRDLVARPLASQIATRGTLFVPLLTRLYLATVVAWAFLVFWPFYGMSGGWAARLAAFVALLAAWGWLFGARGAICAHAFERTLYSPAGSATLLRGVQRKTDHVICATDLRSAEQVYLSGDFVYSYWLGHGGPGALHLARAVQASAALPGAFPPVRLPTRQHAFTGAATGPGGPPEPPAHLVMSDGGVYDNMGEQWARGFADRVRRWAELGVGRTAPDRLVVVNASARVPWSPFRRAWFPLVGEIASLARVTGVMYVNTTNVRRQAIVASFDPTRPDQTKGLASALVQIAQSPYDVARAFRGGTGATAERAKAVIDMLGAGNEAAWERIAEDDAGVATTLSKLGREVSLRLLRHAYTVTMCNLHVIFGDDFPLIPERLAEQHFADLVQ